MGNHDIILENSKENSIHDTKPINSEFSEKVSLSSKYHQSEIDQNNMIIRNAIRMIWVGIVLLFISLLLSISQGGNWVTLIPGVFIDVFSGTMIYLVNKSSENKQKYFDKLNTVEHEERIIELIHTINDEQFKQEMINKIVYRHCKS